MIICHSTNKKTNRNSFTVHTNKILPVAKKYTFVKKLFARKQAKAFFKHIMFIGSIKLRIFNSRATTNLRFLAYAQKESSFYIGRASLLSASAINQS